MDERIPESLAPLFAPLPIPIAEHLVLRLERKQHLSTEKARDLLLREVQQARFAVVLYMNPYVRNISHEAIEPALRFSTSWLLQTLSLHSPGKKALLPQTLSTWHGRGLLRYREYGLPDFDSAAALFIARIIDRGERNFLPSRINEEEPLWWCWRQDDPGSSPVACPISFPADVPPVDVPPSALLWTPWTGAAWYPAWKQVGYAEGAVRFAGFQSRHWMLTPAQIGHWQPELAPFLQTLPREEVLRQDLLNTLADLALLRLATSRLKPNGRGFSG